MAAELWDTSSILSEKSLLGMLLSGLAGYRARPTPLEVAAYVLYLCVAGYLLLWRSPSGGSSRRPEVATHAATSQSR
jgi:high-affinity iron transporter